jgi:hypothetical protein
MEKRDGVCQMQLTAVIFPDFGIQDSFRTPSGAINTKYGTMWTLSCGNISSLDMDLNHNTTFDEADGEWPARLAQNHWRVAA